MRKLKGNKKNGGIIGFVKKADGTVWEITDQRFHHGDETMGRWQAARLRDDGEVEDVFEFGDTISEALA